MRATATVLLTADVSRFYHAIYTHSISWALHTKAIAKIRRRSMRLLGNRLDLLMRNAQDGQTIGIPIGPDTSLIVAEIILAAVDRELVRAVPRLRGFRFMDDYELTFVSRSHAELALARLQGALANCELALNPTKTRIDDLPETIVEPWRTELSGFRIRQTPNGQASDLTAYFDRTYSLAHAIRNISVISYAIGRLRSEPIQEDNWQLFQDLLCQSILAEPGTFAPALEHFCRYADSGRTINAISLGHVVNIQIATRAPLGHASEVAWALWTALRFQLRVTRRSAKEVAKMRDSVVALLALHAKERGLIVGRLATAMWQGFLTTDDLYGSQWLLCYEAAVKGWLSPIGGGDHIARDPNFDWLRRIGVEFYDTSCAAATSGLQGPVAPLATPVHDFTVAMIASGSSVYEDALPVAATEALERDAE